MSAGVFRGSVCRGTYGADGFGYLFKPDESKKSPLFFVQLFHLAMCVARQAKGMKVEVYSTIPKPSVRIGEHKVEDCSTLDEDDLRTFTHLITQAQQLKKEK